MDPLAAVSTPSRRIKNLLWLLALLAAWRLSWWLLADSFSYGLMPEDPIKGRDEGCYTAIEQWLGVPTPTPIRTLEQFLGAILFLGVPLVLVGWYYHRKPFPKM
ncbi:MAG TPA: hypothetical protein VIE43_23155 [Thermoanaerobaculia bacterium]|jgi:hypothetical protein|nr:hypothetical protein [Thermoanaerobaculia bacterium]